MTTLDFFKRTVIVVLVVLVPLLIWLLFDVVLIAVGAILIAALLQLVSEPLTRWCRFPRGLALACSAIVVSALFGGAGYLFGTRIQFELQDVLNRANAAAGTIAAILRRSEFGSLLLAHLQGGGFSITDIASSAFSVSLSFIGAIAITLITGFYFAVEPELYRSGLSRLFAPRLRPDIDQTARDIAAALRLWLIGQLIQMLAIGVLSTLAVWLIGLPSPLALGVIAGVAEFIPFLGPIIASIPAILVATTNSYDTAMWTIAAYLLIHQIESEVLSPMIQRRMVHVPPALMLLGIIAISAAFGPVAFVFGAPIVVIVFVVISKLYLRETLGESVSLPGEDSRSYRGPGDTA